MILFWLLQKLHLDEFTMIWGCWAILSMFLLHDPLFFSRCHAYSLSGSSSRSHQSSIDWTLSSSDVIAPSPWTIFGCQNGKILFHCLCLGCCFFRCWKFHIITGHSWNWYVCFYACYAGLRLFKEAKDRNYCGKVDEISFWWLSVYIDSGKSNSWVWSYLQKWDDHPAIMAVGVVDGTSEAIFQTLMSLGPSRSE